MFLEPRVGQDVDESVRTKYQQTFGLFPSGCLILYIDR